VAVFKAKAKSCCVFCLFVCLLGRSTPPGGGGKNMGVRQKKTREDVVVGKSCSGLGVFWLFFERMGGLKNHYRWLTSVCSSFG
jgi:hypothetical protein